MPKVIRFLPNISDIEPFTESETDLFFNAAINQTKNPMKARDPKANEGNELPVTSLNRDT